MSEETPVTETSTIQPESQEPVKTDREKIYAQYYEAQTPPPSEPPTAPEPEAAAAAQEPAASEPAATKPDEPVPQTQDTEELKQKLAETEALIEAQKRELEALKASMKKPEEASSEEEQRWVDLYREGKFDEGDRALAKRIDELQAQKREQEAQNLMVQTVEMLEAKHRMQKFTDEIKQKNPHLKDLEGVFNSAIERDIVRAKEEGKIKSHRDFADFYIERLKTYVDSANNIVQKSRATGAETAMSRTKEVVANATLPPQEVTGPRTESAPTKEPEMPEDPLQAYIYARRMQAAKRDGVAAQPRST